MNHDTYMQLAIDQARQAIDKGQTPFGAVIVLDQTIVSAAHNQVWADNDITAHAEIVAIRQACQKLKTIHLTGAVIYSTCEPCPMCFSAIHWAKIDQIFYGASIADAKKFGFNELEISNTSLKDLGKLSTTIKSGLKQQQVIDLFELWKNTGSGKNY